MSRALFLILMGTLSVAPTHAQVAAPPDLLEARVTIEYRAAPAADVIGTLAAAAGLTAEIGAGNLRPVTITLTNVKLATALTAVCENASCSWRLQGSLKITPLRSETTASLPPRVSFALYDTPPTEVFRALAAAINVALTVEPSLPNEPVSFNFKSAPTAQVLDMLCNLLQCAWDFDPDRGLRVTQKR
jgi:hypothetical protein